MSIVMLAGQGESTWMVANALLGEFPIAAVVVEDAPSRWQLCRRRAARLGWWTVVGQVLFSCYARRLRAHSEPRAAEIRRQFGLDPARPPGLEIVEVPSANDANTIALLRRLAPRVVVVNGTRILSRRVLESVDAVFLNMHAGITPKYRGVHGGYWALARHDPEHAGVTVHLVNPGIDTGGILYQSRIHPERDDNFTTYPLLQLATGLPLLKRAVRDAQAGILRVRTAALPSQLFYPPTLWQYWLAGVK